MNSLVPNDPILRKILGKQIDWRSDRLLPQNGNQASEKSMTQYYKTKGMAVHFSTGQNKAAIQGGKECF